MLLLPLHQLSRQREHCASQILVDKIHMDTLESVKDASKDFNSNMDKSEKLLKVNQGKEPTVCVQYPKEASRLMPNDNAKRSSEGCINVVASNSETKRNLLGTQRLKCRRCGSKIRQRRRLKRVRLGTFDTGEEASEAYFSKKSEFEKLEKVKTGKKPIVCLESSKEASSVVAAVHGAKSSDGCIDSTVTSNPQAKKNLRGAQRRKSGRYGSSIKDPIRHKRVWLGTFDTAEEASEAYFSKKSEFEKLTKVNQGEELIICVQSPEQASSLIANDLGTKSSEGCINVVTSNPEQASCLMANDLGTKSPEGCINVVTSNPEAKRKSLGTKRLKSGRYGATVQDPITHKQVRLGTFDTVEEASEAYISKKSEFEKLVKVITGKNPIVCVESSEKASSLMTNVHGTKSSDGCINCTVTSNPKDTRSLLGIQRRKSGRYGAAITDPIKHKEVWLGTFDTVEEASEAYFSKKSKCEKSVNFNQGKEPVTCVESSKEASCLMANVHGTGSSNGCTSSVTNHPKAKRSVLGIQRRKNGCSAAVVRGLIKCKKVCLGTSDTVEEASEAFFSKKSFEKLSKGNTENKLKNNDQIQPQSPVGALLSVDNDQTLATACVGKRNEQIVSHKTTHIIGAHKKKSEKYYSVITTPISKKRIMLGTFATAKEAAQAYRSKKLEFQKLIEAKQQCNRQTHVSGREKQDGKEKLVDVKQGHETVNLEGFQPESASGASWSEIDVPMSNSSDGGSEQMIDLLEISHSMGVQTRKSGKYSSEGEEAVHAYQCKKLDSERSKKVELQSPMPTDSSAGGNQEGEEDEDLWMGQWVQLPGDIKEVKFSLKLGLPIIDNYGCLLGEFSSLDDLSIC